MAEQIKKATRDSYGAALVELGAEMPNLVVMDADLSAATKTGMFRKAYPDRFINAGIAEGNMMSVAAGMAAAGKVVFASSFAISPGFSIAGPLVTFRFTFISFAIMPASVVLPSPGGP